MDKIKELNQIRDDLHNELTSLQVVGRSLSEGERSLVVSLSKAVEILDKALKCMK